MNTKPGYWDVDSCAWVGADPTNLEPPMRHAEHAHDRDIAATAAGDIAATAAGDPGVGVPEPRSEDVPSARH